MEGETNEDSEPKKIVIYQTVKPHISVYCCMNCQKDLMDGFFFMLEHYCNKDCCIERYKKKGIDLEDSIRNVKI